MNPVKSGFQKEVNLEGKSFIQKLEQNQTKKDSKGFKYNYDMT
jgi:hypothetical protein